METRKTNKRNGRIIAPKTYLMPCIRVILNNVERSNHGKGNLENRKWI